MRKTLILAATALIALGSLAALGNSPGLIEKIMAAMQVGGSESVQITDRANRKAAKMKNFGKDAPETKTNRPIMEKQLRYIVFNFTARIQTMTDHANQKGQDGSLFNNYFVRQGPLTPDEDLALKTTAGKYLNEIKPFDEKMKTIVQEARNSAGGQNQVKEPTQETKNVIARLQAQRDEITLRYRDDFNSTLGQDSFSKFSAFVSEKFSKNGASSGPVAPEGFCPLDYFGYPTTFFNDNVEPPLITGSSILFYFYDDCGPIYDPALVSDFGDVTTGTLYDEGSNIGFEDIVPAEYDHPIFFSIRGHEFCTIEDEHLLLFDGPVITDDISLEEDYDCHVVGPAPPPTPTPTPTPTPNVVSVTFSQVVGSAEGITANPANLPYTPGGGLRIFPDHDTADEQIDRRLVRVTATLSQPIANVPIYFRNFDLVDPITDPAIYSVINPNPIDGDNKGTPHAGQLLQANACGQNGASTFCPTDANGIATIVFRVTQQPGDNFAIAAGLDPTAVNSVNVNGIELTDGSGQTLATESCPTQPMCRSQMLTIWRRLHIEVDSMSPPDGNFVVGTITSRTDIRSRQTVTIPVTPSSPTTSLEVNRFEGGRIVINGRSFPVASCDPAHGVNCNTADSVTIQNPFGQLFTYFAGAQFTLYDDDDFNDSDGSNVDGDGHADGDSENIPAPDTALLTVGSDLETTNVFAPAYVRPVYDT